MNKQKITLAKQIFDTYDGNYYQMMRDGKYEEYKSCKVSKVIERQWMKEKEEELIKVLSICKNNRTIAEAIEKYLHYAAQMKNDSALDFVFDYILENKNDWDTNTLHRGVNALINARTLEKKQCEQKRLIEKCIMLLQESLKKDIRISDDYKENGKLPEYLSEIELQNSIQHGIQYWLNVLME